MIIIYCDSCGLRISDSDANSGKAIQTGENKWRCGACTRTVVAPSAPTETVTAVSPKRPDSVAKQRLRKHETTMLRTESEGRTRPKSVNTTLVAGICGAAVALLLIVFFTQSVKRDTATNVAGASANAVEEAKAPSAPTTGATVAAKTPPVAAQPVEVAAVSKTAGTDAAAPGVAAGAAPPAPAAPQTPMDRAKQAELDMENFRNGRAQRLLDDARQLLAQNPGEVRAYKRKLNEITLSYGSAPAAAEARKLLDEVKSQPSTLPDDLVKNVAESAEYKLVYDADLLNILDRTMYEEDRSGAITGPFDRIAYYMELTTQSGDSRWTYVSVDAFTTEIQKIGIPFLSTGARFQQTVSNMNVHSNVKEIVTGTNLASGSMEFWGSNYSGTNKTNVPGASGNEYDFGDELFDSGDYGSMQIHNIEARQTIFAFNHWVKGADADIGIGNQSGKHPDWTFSASAKLYRSARLRVLVRLKN